MLRDDESIVPTSDFKFAKETFAHFVSKSKNIDKLLDLLNITSSEANNIMILEVLR